MWRLRSERAREELTRDYPAIVRGLRGFLRALSAEAEDTLARVILGGWAAHPVRSWARKAIDERIDDFFTWLDRQRQL